MSPLSAAALGPAWWDGDDANGRLDAYLDLALKADEATERHAVRTEPGQGET